jgi:hypothetical protein
MAVPQASDLELIEKFLGQSDRHTHSNLKLSEGFSRVAFELVFEYGSNLQKSAIRQALIACVSLPAVSAHSSTPVRNITFERHLSNLLVHVLKAVGDDKAVASYDRDIAMLLAETGLGRPSATRTREMGDRHPALDTEAIVRQLERQLRQAFSPGSEF